MDAKARSRTLLAGGLLVALAAVLAWQYASGGGQAPAPAAARAPGTKPTGKAGRGDEVDPTTLEVRLSALEAAAPEPKDESRDPFRFRPAPPPPPPPPPPVKPAGPPVPVPGGTNGDPSGPPPPPPPPPIALKFIGVVARESLGKIAVLSDGKFVYHGREGDIIEGRYRVVRIGDESVQMEYLDGRGKQTIRLTGS